MQRQPGVFAQVVEQGGGFAEKQRQIVFDAGRPALAGHVFVDLRARRVAFHALTKLLAEGGDAAFIGGEFPRRQQAHVFHRVERALGVHVEGAQIVDFVVEQINAVGQRRAGGKQINQAAAHREFTGAVHLGDVGVAGQRQVGAQGVGVELLPLAEHKGAPGQKAHRRQPGHGRADRGQNDVGLTLADLP